MGLLGRSESIVARRGVLVAMAHTDDTRPTTLSSLSFANQDSLGAAERT
jgi:hypothetical protein